MITDDRLGRAQLPFVFVSLLGKHPAKTTGWRA